MASLPAARQGTCPVRSDLNIVSPGGLATLALETGRCFRGRWFGGSPPGGLGTADPFPSTVGGEVVFHTGMTGYQEILTDPSYAGQIVVFTAAHIGNYGIHAGEDESTRVHPRAIVVRDHFRRTTHQRADRSLEDLLRRANIPGLSDVDTRALTIALREKGACRGVIGTDERDELVAAAQQFPPMSSTNFIAQVTCKAPWSMTAAPVGGNGKRAAFRVAVLDCGVKQSILERLREENCELHIYPAQTPAEEIMGKGGRPVPEGIFLSNGPGDPALLDAQVATISELLQTGVPVFGICLGHQLLSRAIGAETFKLPFGHHGANHPVRREHDCRVEITSHNHNYAVRPESLDASKVRVTHSSLNDDCIEGLELIDRPVYSVQYHPEAAPGPRDGRYLFERFVGDMAHRRKEMEGVA
ncbi:carbamoyl phosphate synthase small subunit [bacterium]|nr:MAG: carbamoyl phosphate synthase small subunit [bacterium]